MFVEKLYSFDFDDTLCHTPLPEEGMPIWLEKTGEPYPHVGWWGREESLNVDVFDIKLNPWVYKEYLKAMTEDNSFTILATGRRTKLRKQVDAILNMHNLAFDEIHLNNLNDTFVFKTRLFERLILEHNPKEFIMYDDREEHLERFVIWASELNSNSKITIVDVVNKTKVEI